MHHARPTVRFRRLGLGLIATLAAAVAALALTASPASAKPVRLYEEPAGFAAAASISCPSSGGDSSHSVRCYFTGPTTTQYRAVVYCTGGATRYGPWYTVNSGNWSTAYCPANQFRISGDRQLR